MSDETEYTPCTHPYPDCISCHGTGKVDDLPCDICVWKKFYADNQESIKTPEEVDAARVAVETYPLNVEKLIERSKKHPIPQSWYDEEEDPFEPE